MYKGNSFLAIVPARGGSKRLPNKNILDLAGKPMIAWTIEAAKASKYIDTVVVTSDSSKILKIANKLSVNTLERPKILASDTASTFDVIQHAVDHLKKHFDYMVLLQPTSPLRSEKHIDEAIEFLIMKNADAVISVCKTSHTPKWSNTLPKNGSLENFLKSELVNKRSQDYDNFYSLNGAIYICKVESLLKDKSLFLRENIFAYIMDRRSSVDVDESIDLDLCRCYLD
jgi:CMP-N,N'-diacetyllegionaminic acid synthase